MMRRVADKLNRPSRGWSRARSPLGHSLEGELPNWQQRHGRRLRRTACEDCYASWGLHHRSRFEPRSDSRVTLECSLLYSLCAHNQAFTTLQSTTERRKNERTNSPKIDQDAPTLCRSELSAHKNYTTLAKVCYKRAETREYKVRWLMCHKV